MARFVQPSAPMTKVWAAATTVSLVAAAWVAGLAFGSGGASSDAAAARHRDAPSADASRGPLPTALATGVTTGNSFSSPASISGYWPSITFDSTAATVQSGEPRKLVGGRYLVRTMWAKWKAPMSGTIDVAALSGASDTGINVYHGSSLGTLTRVGSNDDQYSPVGGYAAPPGAVPQLGGRLLGLPVTAGHTYYFQVGTAVDTSTSTGAGFSDLQLTVVGSRYHPGNDDFAKATTLTLGPGATVTAHPLMNGSTMEEWEPKDSPTPSDVRNASVWYKWTAPANGTIDAYICSMTSGRPSVAVFSPHEWESGAVGHGDLKALGFSTAPALNCAPPGYVHVVPVVQGITYYFQVSLGLTQVPYRDAVLTLSATFSSPYIEKMTPTSGSTSGGTMVTFTGQAFEVGMAVHFGSKAMTVLDSTTTSFTVQAPAHSAGKVSVTVTLEGNTSNAKTFTYK